MQIAWISTRRLVNLQSENIEGMTDIKINEIPDNTIRQKRLKSQRDDGRPTEDDIVREHFGPRGEKKDDPNKLPLEANTRRDLLVIGVK
jgi:hypothetical protein